MYSWSENIQSIHALDHSRRLRFSKQNLKVMAPAMGIHPDSFLLDVGAGPGTLLYRLFEEGFLSRKAIGVDLDSNFVAFANKRAQEKHAPLQFVEADALNLPFADEYFDAVTSHTVIEHLPSAPFLKESMRVLKKGGVLSVMSVRSELKSESKDVLSSKEAAYFERTSPIVAARNEALKVSQHALSPEEILAQMAQAGLKNLDLHVVSYLNFPASPSWDFQAREENLALSHLSLVESTKCLFSFSHGDFSEAEIEDFYRLMEKRYAEKKKNLREGLSTYEYHFMPLFIFRGEK